MEESAKVIEIHDLAVTTTVPGFMTAAEVISKLRVKYHGKTYDVTTPAGMKEAIEARRELRNARISLDKAKPGVKREALDFCSKVEADYKSIRAAISEYEDIPDAAITAVEEQKKREAAERQAKLDAMITNIIKLPLTVVGKSSKEIGDFLAVIEPQEFGAEFQGETLVRAKAAKEQAVTEIRHLHAAAIDAEESAARIKADQEEAERQRLDRDRITVIRAKIELIKGFATQAKYTATIQLDADIKDLEGVTLDEETYQEFLEEAKTERDTSVSIMKAILIEKREAQRLEIDQAAKLKADQEAAAEQKRLNDIESARLKKLADEEAEKLRAERAAFEAEQAEARRIQKEADDKAAAERAEADRIAKEKADAEAAEKKRVQDEADEKRRQEEHAAVVKAEEERKKAEIKAKAEEKARKLAEARCASAADAFKKILGYCESRPADALDQIALIAESNLEVKS